MVDENWHVATNIQALSCICSYIINRESEVNIEMLTDKGKMAIIYKIRLDHYKLRKTFQVLFSVDNMS